MKKLIASLVLCGFMGWVGAVHADGLRMAYSSAPRSIDPYPFGGSPTASLKEHVFEALVAADDSPLLASGWSWDSPTSLTVKLRKGVQFHNGDPLTARDVVYSACRMMFKVGGKRNLLTSSMGPLTDVVALDDSTVRFTTAAPYPLWVQKMKFLSILPASLADTPTGPLKYDAGGDCGITRYPTRVEFENGTAAIGTGPFKLLSYEPTGDANMVRNENYWGSAPIWETLQVRSVGNSGARMAGLLAGDYDVIENPTTEDITSLENNPDFTFTSKPSWRTIFLVLNIDPAGVPGITAADGSAPLANIRVRQALSLAVNREAIVKRLFGGKATVANQFAPSYRNGAPTMPALEYNPQKSKDLLAEAGYPNGFEMTLAMPSGRYTNGTLVGQALTQYFSRIGLKVTLKSEPWAVFAKARKKKEMGIFLYGWGHPQGPAQMISFAFASRVKELGLGSSNYSSYKNDMFDKAIQAWAMETDQTKAKGYVRDAMVQAMTDLPGIPLYYQHSIWAHRADLKIDGRQDERTNAAMVTKR